MKTYVFKHSGRQLIVKSSSITRAHRLAGVFFGVSLVYIKFVDCYQEFTQLG